MIEAFGEVGKFEVRNLGRNKITVKFEVTDVLMFESKLLKAVSPHLMSRELDWSYHCDEGQGSVFAGFRKVGEIRKLES